MVNKRAKTDVDITQLMAEIRIEQNISPYVEDASFIHLIDEGIYDINNMSGFRIDYDEDRDARALLKMYVLYRRFARLSEFKEVYAGAYTTLQIRYHNARL
ncbi:hypothetical protein [Erysipelothrix anatis]|uniref:hypothetical protein n=1 Tax=Erysipelothrix anatis TaxID=2683713 RepID=UPI00135C160D|nr:hypothetical protein [Erysipelothrix anatis]